MGLGPIEPSGSAMGISRGGRWQAENAIAKKNQPINGPLCQQPPQAHTSGHTTALALSLIASLAFLPKASAQTASGLISSWGKTCQMRVVEQFDVPMSDALVTIGATEKQSMDKGTTTLADIKKTGMS